MNKLNKILWGISSFIIGVVYRADAADYADISNLYTDVAVGDTVTYQCDHGKVILKIIASKNEDNSNGQYDNQVITNCTDISGYICDTTTTYSNKCSTNQTATPIHSSAVNPSDFNCSTLTCPNDGTLGKYAQIQQETLQIKKNFDCQRTYTGGSGHRFLGFSFIVSAITASSGWYGSYTTKNSDNWHNQTYNIFWQRVNNNSINDCYIAPGTYTDGNGNTYQQVDSDNKCYYKE